MPSSWCNGNKIAGLLHYTYGGNAFSNKSKGDCRLHYKADSAAKQVKFTSKDIKGFVIGNDSFTVIYNFSINAYVHYPQDFAKVIEVGRVMLYQYDAEVISSSNFYAAHYWIVSKNNQTRLLPENNFKDFMGKLVSDDLDLVDKIKNKELKYKDTREIIHAYNEYVASHS